MSLEGERRKSLVRLAREVTRWGVFSGLAGASLLAASAKYYWLGEAACHFRLYLGWIGIAVCGLLALMRSWRLCVLGGAFAFWHLWPGLGLAFGEVPEPRGSTLDVAAANVLWDNPHPEAFVSWLEAEDPEIVAVLEVSSIWLGILDDLRAKYPHQVLAPSLEEGWIESTWGIALLSKVPFERVERLPIPRRSMPVLDVDIRFDGELVTFRTLHPSRPGNPNRIAARNEQLRTMIEGLSWEGRIVLMGDLNTTSHAPIFGELLRRTGLRDTRHGFGRLPTFNGGNALAFVTLPPMWIPIDHILVSEGLEVFERKAGPAIGSDHLPISARLGLAR